MPAPRRPVTVYDIAERARVSQSTVSRVLSGGAPVASETRARVLEAMRVLDYKPNVVAQDLARGRTRMVGLLTASMASPYLGRLAEGVESELRKAGYRALMASGSGLKQTEEALEFFRSAQVEGVVVLGCPFPVAPLQAIAKEVPLLGIGATIPGLEGNFVRADNEGGGYRATRHLIELGHRAIAHISGPVDHPDAIDRIRGYRRALDEAGIAFAPERLASASFHEEEGEAAVGELLARGQPFSALFVGSDQLAAGAFVGLRRAGLRIPEDVSVVGFDDQPYARYVYPPLTTVAQPSTEMGRALGQILIARIEGTRAVALPPFETPFVLRESTAPPRG